MWLSLKIHKKIAIQLKKQLVRFLPNLKYLVCYIDKTSSHEFDQFQNCWLWGQHEKLCFENYINLKHQILKIHIEEEILGLFKMFLDIGKLVYDQLKPLEWAWRRASQAGQVSQLVQACEPCLVDLTKLTELT